MKLRFVLCFLILGCSTTRVAPALDNLQLRVVEFADHPDPNTGPPHLINGAQPWPADLAALTSAANQWMDKHTYVYDVRRDAPSPSLVETLEETTARVISVSNDSAKVSVTMDGAPAPVEVTVPVNGTVVLGSENGDDRHVFGAVSLFDRAHLDAMPEVFSAREPGVTPPRLIKGGVLPLSAAARDNHLKGAIVNAEVDEQGNVVAAHVLARRFLTDDDVKAIEDNVRTWTFSPAMRNGKPVRALTLVTAQYDQSQASNR